MKTKIIGVLILLPLALGTPPRAHAEASGASPYPNIPDKAKPDMPAPVSGGEATRAPTTSPPVKEYKHYGLLLLAVDATLITWVVVANRPEPLYGFLVSGPAIHVLHDNGKSAVISMALRLGLPLLLAATSASNDSTGPALGALLLGMGILADYTLLARTRIEPTPAQGLVIVPSMSASPDSLSFGLAGRF